MLEHDVAQPDGVGKNRLYFFRLYSRNWFSFQTLNLKDVPPERLNVYKGLLLSTCFTASSAGTVMLTATGANVVLSGYM